MSSLERAISHAKNLHIDECEVIFLQKKIITVRITDSEIAEIKLNHDNEIGIRVIHQKKISSAQTNNPNDVSKIVEQAFESSKLLQPKKFWQNLPHEVNATATVNNLYDKKLDGISTNASIDIANELINTSTHQKISAISGSLNIVSEKIELVNSNGLSFDDKATYISGTINAESKEGNVPVSGIGQASCRTLDSFHPEKIGQDAMKMCIESINPQKPEAGEYSIIFEPYSVGELLSFVVASNFSLKGYSDKRSCFSDKIESEIAVNEFSLIDDPHVPDGIGSKLIDDEGIITKPKYLIQNGIFKNLYSDSFTAFKEETKSSGNALRGGSPMGRSANPIPIHAPHNLRIEGNTTKIDDIIKDTKKGLLIGRLWYTYAVNPIQGDFSCTARSGIRIIENGEIKSPGKSVRIVHNMPVMLKNISAIGDDVKNVLQWASLPSFAPTLKAEKIKVTPI